MFLQVSDIEDIVVRAQLDIDTAHSMMTVRSEGWYN